MKLDYTSGCVNFRDVGMFVNLIADRMIMREDVLYRGGKLQYVKSANEIGSPRSIINLRRGPDHEVFAATYYHFPIANTVEVYETAAKEVHQWLVSVVGLFSDPSTATPFLIHCTSGKDRTGIVTAALLLICDIPHDTIEEEYLLSEGKVDPILLRQALEGIGDPLTYFRRVPDLESIRRRLRAV